jgi:phage terminase small subunit
VLDASDLPEPPHPVSDEVRRWWTVHAGYLVEAGRWEAADAELLCELGEDWALIWGLERRVGDDIVLPPPDGIGVVNPLETAVWELMDRVLELTEHFGFSPLSRAAIEQRAAVSPA